MQLSESVREKTGFQLEILKLNQKLEELESLSNARDEEIRKLEDKLKDLMMALFKHNIMKPMKSKSVGQRRCRKVKEAMATTLFISSISIPIAIHSELIPKKLLPWSVAIGLGTFACSCYFLKDVYNSGYRSRQRSNFPWMAAKFPVAPEIVTSMSSPKKLQDTQESDKEGRMSSNAYTEMNLDGSSVTQSRKRFKTA